MTKNSPTDDEQMPGEVADILGNALEPGQPQERTSGMSRGKHGNVSGDEDATFDLRECTIVAQAYDDASEVGTRLYHVEEDVYALSQFRRSVSQDWTETLQTHGSLTVEPVTLEQGSLKTAVSDADAKPLTADDISFIQSVYADTCRQEIWRYIESERAEGLVPRGRIGCVEDHNWRSTLRPLLAEQLTDPQVEGVLEGLMDARPNVDWTWCQLYAIYIAALQFNSEDPDR